MAHCRIIAHSSPHRAWTLPIPQFEPRGDGSTLKISRGSTSAFSVSRRARQTDGAVPRYSGSAVRTKARGKSERMEVGGVRNRDEEGGEPRDSRFGRSARLQAVADSYQSIIEDAMADQVLKDLAQTRGVGHQHPQRVMSDGPAARADPPGQIRQRGTGRDGCSPRAGCPRGHWLEIVSMPQRTEADG
jgi:hypothetical protein